MLATKYLGLHSGLCFAHICVVTTLDTRWCSSALRLDFAVKVAQAFSMCGWWGYLTEGKDVTYVCVPYIKYTVVL